MQLRERPVLESCAGTMVKASSLKHVPLVPFADGDGIPFTQSSHTAARYMSLRYPAWAFEGTSSIGVLQLSSREFLEDLNSLITQEPTTFRTRSAIWHSQLAETLVKLATDAELLLLIQEICLIPLHDGNWTSAKGQSMFFSKSETSLEIPSGIKALIVDSSVESDPNRRKLFTTLGVKAWEAPEICRLILKVHESSNFDPKVLTADQLISHAAFLYKASWQPPKTANLWFATMQDERCLGRNLYIPGSIETNSPAARIFAQLQKRFLVIKADYLKAFALDTDWPNWLVGNLGLSKVPRLTMPHVDPRPQPTQTWGIPQSVTSRSARNLMQTELHANGNSSRGGNTKLQDYQLQLMLLEQSNKKKLLMARQKHDRFTPRSQAPEPQRSEENKLEGERRVDTADDANSIESLAKITLSVPVGDIEKTFALSEEFIFMFRECQSSDVLQLLRDNWHHYSQWIAGAHMEWQSASFVDSSIMLRNSMGACLVQTVKGSLPLQETVLPTIDPQLDEGRLISAVDIREPHHPEWALLSYFGVAMKSDIHYYLRCLITISDEDCPDIDIVAYVYEKIQARYKENEELIRYVSHNLIDFSRALNNPSAAFNGRDIILVHSDSLSSTKTPVWINMKECLSRDINLESEYPTSSYLFQCLRSPSGDPIAPLVAIATLITSSSKLEDISRLFRDVSAAVKDINASKAAQLLRPLKEKSIFPITNGLGKRRYDKLLDMHNTSWFIADRPHLRESFRGKVPLLALPIEDLNALEDLFRVLRLDNRMLSRLATNQTHPKGRTTPHWNYTNSLRAKSLFIQA